MNRLTDALSLIDDGLIAGAEAYAPQAKRHHACRYIAAACAAAVVLLLGWAVFKKTVPGASPFVITAYAQESGKPVSAAELTQGVQIPVSMFEAESGLWGFVFSYAAKDVREPFTIAIMDGAQGTAAAETVKAISGLAMEEGRHYLFFIPPQDEAGPYRLPLCVQDREQRTVAVATLLIRQEGDGYTALLETLTSHPKREVK